MMQSTAYLRRNIVWVNRRRQWAVSFAGARKSPGKMPECPAAFSSREYEQARSRDPLSNQLSFGIKTISSFCDNIPVKLDQISRMTRYRWISPTETEENQRIPCHRWSANIWINGIESPGKADVVAVNLAKSDSPSAETAKTEPEKWKKMIATTRKQNIRLSQPSDPGLFLSDQRGKRRKSYRSNVHKWMPGWKKREKNPRQRHATTPNWPEKEMPGVRQYVEVTAAFQISSHIPYPKESRKIFRNIFSCVPISHHIKSDVHVMIPEEKKGGKMRMNASVPRRKPGIHEWSQEYRNGWMSEWMMRENFNIYSREFS